MSFLLNYLDEALDSITGRYDGHEGDQETASDGGAVVVGVDVDDASAGGNRLHAALDVARSVRSTTF